MQPRTISLLGAGGFIGSHLLERLSVRDDLKVIALDKTREKIDHLDPSRFRYVDADIMQNCDGLEEVIAESDWVVDLIAYANPSLYVSSPVEVFDLNFTQNLRIAELCMKHNCHLVQYSSAEVYGKTTTGERYKEDSTDFVLGPVQKQRWIYSAAKSLLERVIYAYGDRGDLTYTIIRPFNFIGRRIDYLVPARSTAGPRVFAHFISALLNASNMFLVDGGDVHRAFLHIDDATDAFEAILDQPDLSRNQIFNIGNPENNVTIREFAELMLELYSEISGKEPESELEFMDGDEFYGKGYEDSGRLPPCIEKMAALGWTPKHDLRATLRDAMEFYLCKPGAPATTNVS